MREIVLDTETTGLDPTKGDRLLEIGAVEIVNHVATGATFHVLINPQREVSEGAFRVHGHSTDSLRYCPVFQAVAPEFLRFIAEDPLVIHNADFDTSFLNAELVAAGYPPIAPERVVDTLALARRKHPGAANSLDALCDRYRIDRSRRTRHGALLDARLLAEVYAELCGGRQTSFALSNAPELAHDAGYASIRSMRDAPLPPRIDEPDVEDHLTLVKALGDTAVWLRYLGL